MAQVVDLKTAQGEDTQTVRSAPSAFSMSAPSFWQESAGGEIGELTGQIQEVQ